MTCTKDRVPTAFVSGGFGNLVKPVLDGHPQVRGEPDDASETSVLNPSSKMESHSDGT